MRVTWRAVYMPDYGVAEAENSVSIADNSAHGTVNVYKAELAFTRVGRWNVQLWITNGVHELWSDYVEVKLCTI